MADLDAKSRTLDYSRPMHGSTRATRVLAMIAVSLVGAFLCLSALLPLFNHHDASPRSQCTSNMRQIGQAIAMYAAVHGDRFPDDIVTIFNDGELPTDVFVCPSTNDSPVPAGPTTQATAAALLRPGHLSYIYLGQGLTSQTTTSQTVLLYEPPSNHAGEGMNVLFGDFHVEWLPVTEGATILKQVAAKKVRVVYPLTQPFTATNGG